MEKILDIHKFIETVRNHPCLYDLTSVDLVLWIVIQTYKMHILGWRRII